MAAGGYHSPPVFLQIISFHCRRIWMVVKMILLRASRLGSELRVKSRRLRRFLLRFYAYYGYPTRYEPVHFIDLIALAI